MTYWQIVETVYYIFAIVFFVLAFLALKNNTRIPKIGRLFVCIVISLGWPFYFSYVWYRLVYDDEEKE